MSGFRTDRMRYPNRSAYVKTARDRVRTVATDWGLAESVVDDLALVVSELVTNAVLHVGPVGSREIGVTLFLNPEYVRVEVRDSGTGLPVVKPLSAGEPDGRGLILVRHLADRWDALPQVVGKIVFAEIDLKSSTPLAGCGVGHV
ncbi:ATP-binding protein [Streptomyces sp. NBC_00414]|uniref:ATP-binding protein n=1 Tax=Streptomyces sp. NBC_00414 TaxID=2975739 RepID=UPI002E1F4B96